MKAVMQKYKKMILIIIIVSLFGVIAYGNSPYQDTLKIYENETIDGDLIVAVNHATNEGNIKGDWITAGQQIRHLGMIGGDLIAAASQIFVDGNVRGNLRLVAREVIIGGGEINRNASIFASNVGLEEDTILDGSLHVYAGDLALRGFVGGDIIGGVGNAVISGTVKGNINLSVDKIYLEPGAYIEGNLTYISEEEQYIDTKLVKGNIEYQPTRTRSHLQRGLENIARRIRRVINLLQILFLISYIILGLFLIKFFKKPLNRATQLIDDQSGISVLLGLGFLFLVPIGAILLMVTIIGIPISILALALYGILVYLAKIPVALWLGKKIIRDESRYYTSFIVGNLLIATVSLIPYGGKLLSVGITALGMGSTLIVIKKYYNKEYDI
ncbi:bactofilin family protein [Alkaliphilus transvaalensis]|uniref:hypothetical protein n=1 Tax=Alkaliphilus transvaalensis TaxID=114628 RepID=UPI00047C1E31|nr:hypothetical protein [Alkaliphilus transvaalensis]